MANEFASGFSQTTPISVTTIATDAASTNPIIAGWYLISVDTQACSIQIGAAAALLGQLAPGVYGPFLLAPAGDTKLHAIGAGAGPGHVFLIPVNPA